MTFLLRRFIFIALLFGQTAVSLFGHDPFDGVTRMFVHQDSIEIEVTVGSDAARELLKGAGLSGREVARMTRSSATGERIELPTTVASRLYEFRVGDDLLEAKSCLGVPGETESIIIATYPKPAVESLLLHAVYFANIQHMNAGPFAALADDGYRLATALLSSSNSTLKVPLAAPAASSADRSTGAPHVRFVEYLELGITHILGGFDHLLFLCALLAGVRKIRPMLIIITCFTLGHSVTLALAALDWVTIPSRVIEPMIAASIIFVGLENFFRADITRDRYWMAGGFGLIHGFGFASALRETGLGSSGASVVMPLFSFNLGVEVGQLLVAALVVPLLLFLRQKSVFARYMVPAISVIVIVISGYWLLERTVFAN